jgi:hypothetical protein
MRNPRIIPVVGVLAALALAVGSGAAQALDPWEFEVYPYLTTPRGVLEIESLNAVVASGHQEAGEGTSAGIFPSQGMWFNAYEFTYGLTDRIEAAGYLNFAKPGDHGYRFAGDKFRLRGQLFEQGVLPVDLGWYVELEQHVTPAFDAQRFELELKPIIEKDIGRVSLRLNPIFEKPLGAPEGREAPGFGYAAGIYYPWHRSFSPGLEAYGGAGEIGNFEPVSNQQHYLFPVVWGVLPHGIEYNFGVGFGLTPGSDRVIVKLNIELERFIGALFGPSPASGWLY